MRFGNLLFDPKFRYASRSDGKTIQFTPVETAALALLTEHVGQILPRQRLLDATQRLSLIHISGTGRARRATGPTGRQG